MTFSVFEIVRASDIHTICRAKDNWSLFCFPEAPGVRKDMNDAGALTGFSQ